MRELYHKPELHAVHPACVGCVPMQFQSAVSSVHLYPFVVVIEKRDSTLTTFSAPKHGTQWQPFL